MVTRRQQNSSFIFKCLTKYVVYKLENSPLDTHYCHFDCYHKLLFPVNFQADSRIVLFF